MIILLTDLTCHPEKFSSHPKQNVTYSMVPDYTRAGIIKHRFFKPLFEDIYGMEIEFFSYRPIDTIDLNFYGCSISFLQP